MDDFDASPAERLVSAGLPDGIVAVDVDDEVLLLDREDGRVVRLDASAVARLHSDEPLRQMVLDTLSPQGSSATDTGGVISRRRMLAAGAAAGITVLVLPTAKAAASPAPAPDVPVITPEATVTLGSIAPVYPTTSADGTRVYVGNYGSTNDNGTVSLITTSTNSVSTFVVSGLSGPWIAVPSVDGTRLYVTNNAPGTNGFRVKVYNTGTGELITTIFNNSQAPSYAMMNADGSRLYVVNGGSGVGGNSVTVIDTDPLSASYHTILTTITGFSRPWGLAVTGARLYVTNNNVGTGTTVSVVNTSDNTISATITVGTGPRYLAITPDGKRAYVANRGSGTVSVIDTDPASGTFHQVIATLSGLTTAQAVAITPNSRLAFVSLESLDEVKVIDINPASNTFHTVIDTLTTGDQPNGLVVRPDGQRLYVANSLSNTVSTFTLS